MLSAEDYQVPRSSTSPRSHQHGSFVKLLLWAVRSESMRLRTIGCFNFENAFLLCLVLSCWQPEDFEVFPKVLSPLAVHRCSWLFSSRCFPGKAHGACLARVLGLPGCFAAAAAWLWSRATRRHPEGIQMVSKWLRSEIWHMGYHGYPY